MGLRFLFKPVREDATDHFWTRGDVSLNSSYIIYFLKHGFRYAEHHSLRISFWTSHFFHFDVFLYLGVDLMILIYHKLASETRAATPVPL